MIATKLSAKNQITLPKFFLELLNVRSGDKLLLDIEKDEIKIKPLGKSIVSTIAGSINIPKEKKGIPYDKVLEITKKRVAKRLAKK